MDLDIAQLDSEERRKIATLYKERHDVDRDKGVEYIFRQPDRREEFLLGKKIDVLKMVKDDKAMMGETEEEFKQRMERKKLMQKMSEDPMAIIQYNEQLARKVEIEKQLVHQKYVKKIDRKFYRRERSDSSDSSNDSEASNCFDSLRSMLMKMENNESVEFDDIKKVNTRNNRSEKKDKRDRDVHNSSKRRIEDDKIPSHKHGSSTIETQSRSRYQHRCREYRTEKSPTRKIRQEYYRSRSNDKRKDHRRPCVVERKPKLSLEEMEKRRKEMMNNAKEVENKCKQFEKLCKDEEEKEKVELDKYLPYHEEFMLKEAKKLQDRFSLKNNLKMKEIENRVNKSFRR